MNEQTGVLTNSPEETSALGVSLARELRGGDVVLLTGDIGAGKSVFARGVGRGMGAGRWRGSPTFTLINEYSTSPPLYHVDLYRLGAGDVEDLGLEEYARSDAIMLVEWAERSSDYLRGVTLGNVFWVELEYEDAHRRWVTVHRATSRPLRGGHP